jgi:decaprenyl-phosphate phosphoribosyltransferase
MSATDQKSMPLVQQPQAYALSSSVNAVSATALGPAHTGGLEPSPSSVAPSRPRLAGAIWPYVQIARIDHWFKNAFMILGTVLAVFYRPELFSRSSILPLLLAVASTCLIASSNYVLNEILDGPRDRLHPQKRSRPVPSGRVRLSVAYVEWLLLALAGVGLSLTVNGWFAASGLALWIMGVAYNVPPLRTKEWPYIDVLSESANNAIRLMLGWFALTTTAFPPVSLTLSYWMLGAFFMATKRFAEYRHIADPALAAGYRRSFQHYTEERLLVSILFYATACALFAGIFIVRYHLELILFVPFGAGVFAYYLSIGMQADSPAQNPEKLYRQRGFFGYMLVSVAIFIALMFMQVPILYDWFNVEPSGATPLWTIGSRAQP